MQPYKGKKYMDQDEDDARPKKKVYKKKDEECPYGLFCENLSILNGCKKKHKDGDKKLADLLYELKKKKNFIVIFESKSEQKGSDVRPICLQSQQLPIQIVEQKQKSAIKQEQSKQQKREDPETKKIEEKKIKYEAGFYYESVYEGVDLDRKIIKARIVCQLCKFGNAQKQVDLLYEIGQPKYFLVKPNENCQLLTGTIRQNWDHVRVLKCNAGNKTHAPIYFTAVMDKQFPVTEGCTVKYSLDKNSNLKIYSVKHQKFKFTGLLQVDRHGVFYIRCRNWKYQTIDIPNIPEILIEKVKELQKLTPYCILRPHKIAEKDMSDINTELKKYLMKGHFVQWPVNCYQPIGVLEAQFNSFCLKSLKEAVIFEYMINPVKHSQKQKKQSIKLLSKIEKQNQKLTKNANEQYVFTVDGFGTSCHDDALSIKVQSPNQQRKNKCFRVGIHISDVDEYVPSGSLIDQEVRKNDKTTYIKGYYNPMFYAPLMKFFSLSHGNNKLTYSLYFSIREDGIIDFNSIQFKPCCMKISKNYFHSPKLKEQKELLSLYQLNEVIQSSKILSYNSLGLNQQSETEAAIDSLMLISSMIPSFMWKFNGKRIEGAKKKVDEFVKNLVEKVKQLIKEWEKSFKQIKSVEKELSKVISQKDVIIRAIKKSVQTELKKFQQELKQKNKEEREREKIKKQKNKEKIIQDNQQSQSSEDGQQTIGEAKTVESLSEKVQKQKQLKQMQKQEERQNKLKEALNKVVVIGKKKVDEDQPESSSSQSEDQIDRESQKRKMSQAQAALKYLQKVFDILNVKIKWVDREQIKRKFEEAKRYDDSQLFKDYIKRMYILNHQHFKYLIKLHQQQNRNDRKYRVAEQRQERQERQEKFDKKKYQKNAENLQAQQNQKPRTQTGKQKYRNKQEEKPENKIQKKVLEEQKKAQKKEYQNKQVTMTKSKMQDQTEVVIQNQNKLEEEIVRQKIIIQLDQTVTNETPKREIRPIGVRKGKQFVQKYKDKFRNLLFQLFSQSILDEGLLQLPESVKIEDDVKIPYLKGAVVGIRSAFDTSISEQKRKRMSKFSDRIAKQLHTKIMMKKLNDKEMDQQIKGMCRKAKNKVRDAELHKVIEQAMIMKQLRRLCFPKKQQKTQVTKTQQEDRQRGDRMQTRKGSAGVTQQKDKGCASISQQKNEQNKKTEQRKNLTKQQMQIAIKKFFSFYKQSITTKINDAEKMDKKISEITQPGTCLQTSDSITEAEDKLKQSTVDKQELIKNNEISELFSNQLYELILKQKKHALSPQLYNQQKLNLSKQLANRLYEKNITVQKIKKIKNMCRSAEGSITQKFTQKGKEKYKEGEDESIILSNIYNMSQEFLIKQNPRFCQVVELYCYCSLVQQASIRILNKYMGRKSTSKKQAKSQKIKPNTKGKQQEESKSINQNEQHQICEQKLKKQQEHRDKEPKQKQIIQVNQKNEQKKENEQNSTAQPAQSSNIQSERPKQEVKNKPINESKKSKKKEQRKMLEQKKKQLIELFSAKKQQQIKIAQQAIEKLTKSVGEHKKVFKESLLQIEEDYNILDYILSKLKKRQKKSKDKKSKKQKKKDKKQDSLKKEQNQNQGDEEEYQFVQQICDIIDQYAKKSEQKFKIMKVSEIEEVLQKRIDVGKQISAIENEKLNKQLSELSRDEQLLLKWNNPIRSYDALQTMRLIKDYEWVFNSKISPLDILIDYRAIKQIKSRISSIQKSKIEKMESESSDKKHKQANRQIQKIQFFYKIRKDPNRVYQLLNVTSPVKKVKFVYHPSLGQIEVKNHDFEQKIFRVVEGKFEVVSEFPIEVKAVLIK